MTEPKQPEAKTFLKSFDEALPEETWQMRYPALARFCNSYTAIAALIIILFIIFAATFGPMIWDKDPTLPIDYNLVGEPQSPSAEYPAGTDYQGRDMLARLLLGARISLAVGFVSMLINLVIGVGIGTLAGWIGGKIDSFLMRIVDALYSIPLLLIVINLQIFLKPALDKLFEPFDHVPFLLSPDLLSIYLALGISNWLTMARLTRAEVLNVKKKEFIDSTEALGAGHIRQLLRHVLPNCMAPLFIAATLAIPEAIFVESFLAFIGIGVSPPLASWGSLAEDGIKDFGSPHLLFFPAVAISLTMLAFNLFGDGLRDAFDPKGKK